jgi:hypothetical protein
MQSHTFTINIADNIFTELSLYTRSVRKTKMEDAIAELLQYALMMSPRQRLLDVRHTTPDANSGLSEEEQCAIVDRVRESVYQDKYRS